MSYRHIDNKTEIKKKLLNRDFNWIGLFTMFTLNNHHVIQLRDWILESEFGIAFYWSFSYGCVCVCQSLNSGENQDEIQSRSWRNTILVTKCELENWPNAHVILLFSFSASVACFIRSICFFFLYRLIDRLEIDKKKTNDCFCCGLCAMILTVLFFFFSFL